MAPTLIDPLLFILSFGIGLGTYVADVEGQKYMNFIAPGLVMSTALFTAFFETSYGFFIRLNFESIYKAMLTTPIGVDELIAGEFIWVAIKGAFMSMGVSIVVGAFGLIDFTYLLFVPVLGALVGLSCGALGFMSSAIVKNINQFQTVYALLIGPMFFFSGIFYPVANLPEIGRWLSGLSPLYHAVQLSRSLLLNNNVGDAMLLHFPLLLLMTLLLIWAAIRLVRPKLYQ